MDSLWNRLENPAPKRVTFLDGSALETPFADVISSMLATDDCGDEDMHAFVQTLCADSDVATSAMTDVDCSDEELVPDIMAEPNPPPQPPPIMDTTVSMLLDSIFTTNNPTSALSTSSIPQATINNISSPTDTEAVDSAEILMDDILQCLAGGAGEILDSPAPLQLVLPRPEAMPKF